MLEYRASESASHSTKRQSVGKARHPMKHETYELEQKMTRKSPSYEKKKNRKKKNKETKRNAPHFPCGFGWANGKQKRSIFRARDRTHGKATHISPRPMLSLWHCVLSLFVLFRSVRESRYMDVRTFPTFLYIFVDKTSL